MRATDNDWRANLCKASFMEKRREDTRTWTLFMWFRKEFIEWIHVWVLGYDLRWIVWFLQLCDSLCFGLESSVRNYFYWRIHAEMRYAHNCHGLTIVSCCGSNCEVSRCCCCVFGHVYGRTWWSLLEGFIFWRGWLLTWLWTVFGM